jgi:hypothetical protein
LFYLLYFPEKKYKQGDQDETIEILDQAKARFPEWHEPMVYANIDILKMYYEESLSYFKHFENLEKIRRTNGPNPSLLPVDDKKTVSVTSSVGKSKYYKVPTYGVTIVTRTTTTRLTAEQVPNLNNRKKACFEAKA